MLELKGVTKVFSDFVAISGISMKVRESEFVCVVGPSGCGKTVSMFLQGLKETGADPGELWRVEWTDINKESKTITINHPVKRHNARILPISRELIDRLSLLPKRSERIFPMLQSTLYNNFWYRASG